MALHRFSVLGSAGKFLIAALAIGTVAVPSTPAEARVHVGIGIGIGFPLFGPYYAPYYGPAYYYPPAYAYPPAYGYAYPPAAYVPAPAAQPSSQGNYSTANCRDYTNSTIIDGKPQRTVGTACQQPDGTWRIVN